MCGIAICDELPAASLFARTQLTIERAQRLFRRAQCTVDHTLYIASDPTFLAQLPPVRRTRMAPCAWGVRRDDYRWRGEGGAAFSTLLKAATLMGKLLVQAPLPGWSSLLPGNMRQVMNSYSELYLADYWVLTLHHLVWAGRLPYPIRTNWFCGQSVHDDSFGFVSELPAHLAEASLDALILFREAALTVPHDAASAVPIIEPPALNGWCRQDKPIETPSVAAATEVLKTELAAPSPASAPAPEEAKDEQECSVLPQLNDQTFTVCSDGKTYRFTARNKQLFALLDRIHRRPGHRVAFDDLRGVGDVWDGYQVEDSTIGGSITRLRKLLKGNGMNALAECITTGSYQGRRYVLLQDGDSRDTAQ